MNVEASSSSAQMQMRKMDGSGGGQGNGGMRDIMQSLSTEDRSKVQDQLSSMTQEDRVAAVNEMKQVDSTTMTSEDYTQALLDILNQDQAETDYTSSVLGFSVYA